MSFPYVRCHQGFLRFPLRRLRNLFQYLSHPSESNADPSELWLRLDGVHKKWGRPTYSSSETSSSSSSSQKTVNGISKVDATGTVNSKAHDNSYNSRKPQVEISLEKQKLAASLFGGSSKTEKRGSTVGHKAGKASIHVAEKPQTTKALVKTAVEKIVVQPLPDLLDLGEPTVVSSSPPSGDPFKQLEELIDPTQVTSSVNHDANKSPDLMGLYAEIAGTGPSTDDVNPLSGFDKFSCQKCS